jgi:hypothetical protein
VKRAIGKLLGIVDGEDRTIHLDPGLHPKRRLYVTVHEIAHDALPHQRDMFRIMQDSESEIDPETKDLFEREANCFASDVLFQMDGFAAEAAEYDLGIKTPIELSKKYGPSIYATARRYVATHRLPCALLVFELPVPVDGGGEILELRRVIASVRFTEQFGSVRWPQMCDGTSFFLRNCPRHRFSAIRPLRVPDRNGDRQACLAEAFNTSHHILFLVYPAVCAVTKAR